MEDRKGYIYKITNDLNDKVYIGQTIRDPYVRFNEHCFDSRSTSQIHKAIKEFGYQHFKYEVLEECGIEELDEREKYWVEECEAYTKGYNSTVDGSGRKPGDWIKHYNKIMVKEPGLVFDSKEEMGRIISSITSWGLGFAKSKISECVDTDKKFLDKYTLVSITECENSSIDDCEEWARKLSIEFNGSKIRLKELNLDFDRVSEAAVWLLVNEKYSGKSKTPLQTLITDINKGVQKGSGVTENEYHFEKLPGSTKQMGGESFKPCKVRCPQLDVVFNSGREAAEYFESSGKWGKISKKNAIDRVSDLCSGYFREYKGYTLQKLDKDGNWKEPELLKIQLPYMTKEVNIDWKASDDDKEDA